MINKYALKDEIFLHFKQNKSAYILSFIFIFVGIIIGIIIGVTEDGYFGLLNTTNHNLIKFITGNINYVEIFVSKLLNALLCVVLIFIFNLHIYSSFLSLLFLSYQSLLFILTCFSVIGFYGLTGILNVALIIIPLNLINIFIMCYGNIICLERANVQSRYRTNFKYSFYENNFIIKFISFVVLELLVSILSSFIFPLIIKSLVIVSF